MFDLSGKTALVTGASGAIGGAIAQALDGAGARVALSGTRVEALEAAKAGLKHDPVVLPCSLSDAAAVDALVGQAEGALGGRLDILVSNAGMTKDGLLLRMKDEDWDAVLRVNLDAYFRLSRAALKNMMRNRWGRIIGITSVVAATGNPGQTNYSASKAGMIGFSKALAAEVASRNVTVNCVAPGFIRSAMTDVLSDAQKSAMLGRIPAGRLGEGDDVAAATLYLASEEAGYVTGHTLHVNGGMAMM
ncbi:MAG: 3-oxoacyl-[acyl-carrier-protein] reductase [Hyphomonadaceae bacterium]|nr:3-oxoacyl-[acyl-carrier-protein] reductase [Hyphomonadaceae bacterium]